MATIVTLRWAGKTGRILFSIGVIIVIAYAAAGFYLVPYLIRTQILSGVSELTGAELSLERLEFDPFRLMLDVQGFSLKDQSGRELAVIQRLSAEFAGWESIRQRRLTVSGRIVESTLHPRLDTTGKLNFAALVSSQAVGHSAFPVTITHLTLEHSHIEFEDASHGSPYIKILKDVELNLWDFGLEPESKASMSFRAKSADDESLSAAGNLSLSPLVLEGRMQVANVEISRLTDYLLPDSPWQLKSGRASAKADYRLLVGNNTAFDISSGEGRGEDLQLADRETGNLRSQIKSLSVGGFVYSPTEQRLALESARLGEVVTPGLKADSLSIGGLSYFLAERRCKLDALAIKDAALAETPSEENRVSTKRLREWANAVAVESVQEPLRLTRIGSLKFSGINCALNQQAVTVDSIVSERSEVNVRRLPAGNVKLGGLTVVNPSTTGKAESSGRWSLRISEARLNGTLLGFRDETVQPPVQLDFAPTTLWLTDFSTEPGSQFKFRAFAGLEDTGKIELDGQARLTPLEVDLRFGVDRFQLRSLQPYWQDRSGIDLVEGRLNLWGDLTLRRDPDLRVDYSGGADIVNLATIDKREGKPFIRWSSLKFDELVVHNRPRRFAVRTVTAEHPYAQVSITEDGEFNLLKELVRWSEGSNGLQATDPPETHDLPWSVVAGLLRVRDGRINFADFSWKPGYANVIRNLDGTFGGLSSQQDARASVLLEGRSDHNALVKIAGQINPFQLANHTDVAMEFRDINLATLSPYSGKFAGYRIEKGKLDMNLRYQLHNRRLMAENRLVLDHLVLGERVDSPAATTLPVDLAVTLLKDANGQINLDLPVSGNLDDPEFSLGSLYAKAATHLISDVVSSPFSLLSNLLKDRKEDLEYVIFRPGDISLKDEEKAKLATVAGALKAKPALKLDIRGSADLQQDRLALAEKELLKQLNNAWRIERRVRGEKAPQSAGLALAYEDYRRLFTEFCLQHHPDIPELQTLAGGELSLLQEAMFERAKRRVLDQWSVKELDLRRLAQARSESIRAYLVREFGVEDQRIYLLDVNLNQPGNREIKALLSVSGS